MGHIFTVEPMINLGGYRDVTWPDKWTAVTVDGSRSAQFEHTMVVTESGQGLLHCFQPINPSTPITLVTVTILLFPTFCCAIRVRAVDRADRRAGG